MNRDAGLEEAIKAVGGIGALARAVGIAQPSLSNWRRVPAERVLAVEGLTGVPRARLRPDLYPADFPQSERAAALADDIDRARAQEYALLGALLLKAPDAAALARIARLQGDATPLGVAHMGLAEAATANAAEAVRREYFDLFIGVGRGEIVPYASWYLTGFLNDLPLARLRENLARLGLERAAGHVEPEDHIGTLCEIMSGLADESFGLGAAEEGAFFTRHLAPWAGRFFADLEAAPGARFYKAVGAIGRIFMEIDAEAFVMPR